MSTTAIDHILGGIKKNTSLITKIVAVALPIAAVVGAAHWYLDNVWRPKVTVTSVDYDKKIATITIGKKTRVLYAGSTIGAGFRWGVRFAGDDENRIELVRDDLTFKILSINKTDV